MLSDIFFINHLAMQFAFLFYLMRLWCPLVAGIYDLEYIAVFMARISLLNMFVAQIRQMPRK